MLKAACKKNQHGGNRFDDEGDAVAVDEHEDFIPRIVIFLIALFANAIPIACAVGKD